MYCMYYMCWIQLEMGFAAISWQNNGQHKNTRKVIIIKQAFFIYFRNQLQQAHLYIVFQVQLHWQYGEEGGVHTPSISATSTSLYILPLSVWHTKMANDWERKTQQKFLKKQQQQTVKDKCENKRKRQPDSRWHVLRFACNSWGHTDTGPVSPSQISVIWDHLLLTNSALTIVSSLSFFVVLSPPSSPVLHVNNQKPLSLLSSEKNQWLVAFLGMIKTRWKMWFFWFLGIIAVQQLMEKRTTLD